jgi:CubicO group peptidase (beta-lactamase class C family)
VYRNYLIQNKNTKLFLGIYLSILVILSCISFSSLIIFKQQQVVAYPQQQQHHPSFVTTNLSETELSNMLLNQFKQIVFKYLTNGTSTYSDSTIPVSIVVGVVSSNGTQVSEYGNISKANNTKVDGNTIFDIASITKTFATIVLADMVKQGLVKLNEPIEKYLPANNITVPSFNGHKITLKHLATHTSGLPDFPEGWVRNTTYTNQQVYDFISNTTINREPGTLANYSDIGMGLLGHILSIKAGIPFSQLVKDKILDVIAMDSTGIGMNNTGISVPDEHKARFAKGHIDDKEVNLEFIPAAIQAAGAMYSTTNDLLKYISANIDLIHTEINYVMQDTHLIRHLFAPSSSNQTPLNDTFVGLGWVITTDFGKEVIWHNGAIDGYSSIIAFNPSKQIGLVILCSCDVQDVPPKAMIEFAVPFLLHYS